MVDFNHSLNVTDLPFDFNDALFGTAAKRKLSPLESLVALGSRIEEKLVKRVESVWNVQ